MAHHKSAKKRIRQTETRTDANKVRRTRIRTYIKNVEAAIDAGEQKEAATALVTAQSELMKGVTKGVFKKPTASRKISRLAQRIKKLAA